MAAPADPTMTPAAGLVNAGTDVEIDTVVDVNVYYTLDGTTPDGTSKQFVAGDFDDLLDNSGDNLNIKAVAYNAADVGFTEPSAVVEFNYQALGLSAAVAAAQPALVDTGAGQNGSVNAGIGRTGADGADAALSRLGTGVTAEVVFETGDGIGV